MIATGKARIWGPTDIPITYDPPVKDPSEIAVEREAKADGPDLFVCWMQKAPARQLVNLKNIPVVVMAAEASYHQSTITVPRSTSIRPASRPNSSACRTKASAAMATW